MAVGSLLFSAGCVFLGFDEDLNLFKRAALGLGGGAFFGVCFYFTLVKLVDKTPSLTISEAGIVDNSSALRAGLIRWEDIVALQILDISKQKLLGVEVRNPDKYLDAMGPLARRAASFNQKQCGYAILFPQTLIGIPLVEVIHHIEQRLGRTASRSPTTVPPGAVQVVLELLL